MAETIGKSSTTREAILQAALDEFSVKGFQGATTRTISARAGLTNGVIRYHFENKEKLWLDAIEFLFLRLEIEVSLNAEDLANLQNGDVETFQRWLRNYVRYCARHPEHARIILQASVEETNRLKSAVDSYISTSHGFVARMIEQMQRSGFFPANVPPASILYIITGSCQTIFALAPECLLSLGYDSLSKEAVEAHADAVVQMLCPSPV